MGRGGAMGEAGRRAGGRDGPLGAKARGGRAERPEEGGLIGWTGSGAG